MKNASLFNNFLKEGKLLKDEDQPVQAHNKFNEWVESVFDYINNNYNQIGRSGEWMSLKNSSLVIAGTYYDESSAWYDFIHAVDLRVKWLSEFQKAVNSLSAPQLIKDVKKSINSNKIFIVHGRNELRKIETARLIENLGLSPIILHEKPNKGRTIIEKFRDHSDVSFAIILLTADDVGGFKTEETQESRARQNVIFEFGYFLGKLGPSKVCVVYERGVEIPSDLSGVAYIEFDSGSWKFNLGKELKEAGFNVDLNLMQ